MMNNNIAGVVKLVDIPDLGSGAARHGGSSPSTRTELVNERMSELVNSLRLNIRYFTHSLIH